MPTTTSLLRSAAAARQKVRDYEDQVAAFNWESSAKTYEQFLEYSKFLDERSTTATTPSDSLSYQSKIRTARRSYVSEELQREQIKIMEGSSTTADKMQRVRDLYGQAIENGDSNLAQNLYSQWSSLSIKLQNEAEAAQRATNSVAMAGVKSLGDFVKQVENGTDFIELPSGQVIKPLAMLSEEVKSAGNTSDGQFFREAYDTLNALSQVIYDAYQGATTQEAADAIADKYADVITGTKKFDLGGMKLTQQDMEIAYKSAAANNPVYYISTVRNPRTGEAEYKFEKSKIDDFVWLRNDDGTYQTSNTYAKSVGPNQTLDTQITDDGYIIGQGGEIALGTDKANRNEGLSIKNRLANQGVIAESNADGTLTLTLPTGEQYQGTIQPDGTVRYYGQPGQFSGGQAGIYEINVITGKMREVAPDETSIFGTDSVFGGKLSQASEAGKNILKSYAGQTRTTNDLFTGSRISNIENDFSGVGSPVSGANLQGTTGILQKAEAAQEEKRMADLQAQKQAAMIQPATIFNLNQTPVQQFAQNGQPIRQLTVARPAPTPRVSVSAPVPTPRISTVSVSQPTQRISGVTSLPAQPRLVVR